MTFGLFLANLICILRCEIEIAGNMVDWWTEGDGKEYEKRVEVMVKQANEYEVYGQSVKVCVSYRFLTSSYQAILISLKHNSGQAYIRGEHR